MYVCARVFMIHFIGISGSCKRGAHEILCVSIISILKAFLKPQDNGRTNDTQQPWPYWLLIVGIYFDGWVLTFYLLLNILILLGYNQRSI